MNEKWVGKSLTVWGGIVAALPGIFAAFDIKLDAAGVDAAGIAVIEGASVVVGLVMVIIGRLRANTGTPVTLKPKL